MFLRYFEPLTLPFKAIRNRWMRVRNIQGRIRVDVGRVKSYKQLAKLRAKEAKQMASNAKQKAQVARGRMSGGQGGPPGGPGGPMQGGPMPAGAMAGGGMAGGGGMQGGAMPGGAMRGAMAGGPMAYQGPMSGGSGGGPAMAPGGAPGYPQPGGGPGGPPPAGFPGGAPGGGFSPGGSGPLNGTNGIVVTGALWWKKHLCAQCGQQLDKTWDRCPYCSQGAPIAASHKTQAIMIDAAGAGNGLQLCGWLVGLKGAQRGELFTLEPVTSIGTDPGCTVVLFDSYMSSRHCEIRAEGGQWVLRDLRSTNGTYVNDKRIEQHELVDSDFIKLGQSVVKFKSL
ncbi:MAG TPA: FHA domain-containing protein [Kofleriaceae bacterium]|nr:FHA domain-containing protein [Kofleriaceae bacterium]